MLLNFGPAPHSGLLEPQNASPQVGPKIALRTTKVILQIDCFWKPVRFCILGPAPHSRPIGRFRAFSRRHIGTSHADSLAIYGILGTRMQIRSLFTAPWSLACKSARYLRHFGASHANPFAIYSTLEPRMQIRSLFTALWSLVCRSARYLQHFGPAQTLNRSSLFEPFRAVFRPYSLIRSVNPKP